ncbi:MAG TPA: ABC transporter substrate-binding protein, partial [Vicinamibacterales bacterium]
MFSRSLVLLSIMVALGCGSQPAATNVITVAVLSSPNNLDPRIGSDETSQRVHQLVFDYLLALDEQLRPTGGLATHWEQPDPLTYIVYLRKSVRFHDGHELTADDVVHTFSSFIDPNFISPRKGAYRMLDRVEAVDAYTVRFTLKEPFGSFPIQLVMPVVPKGAGPELREKPIGTGPYRFVSFAVDDHVTLEAFPGYFRGAPANAGVVLKV